MATVPPPDSIPETPPAPDSAPDEITPPMPDIDLPDPGGPADPSEVPPQL